jgi:hypothetical protein
MSDGPVRVSVNPAELEHVQRAQNDDKAEDDEERGHGILPSEIWVWP